MTFYILDLVGVAVFTVSGALAAGRTGLDLFGVLVMSGRREGFASRPPQNPPCGFPATGSSRCVTGRFLQTVGWRERGVGSLSQSFLVR